MSNNNTFTHLHTASALSMRFGTAQPRQLVEAATEHGQTMLALTDRDTVAGAVAFIQACAEFQVAPIVGVDIALGVKAVDSVRSAGPTTPAYGGKWLRQERPRVVLLAHDATSWAGVCEAITMAHRDTERSESPGISRDTLLRIAGQSGAVVLLGPRSDVGSAIAARRPDRAYEYFTDWRDHGVRTYCEVVTHREASADDQLSDVFAARMLQWAVAHRVPAVLSNAVRYLQPRDSRIADVLDAARLQVALSTRNRLSSTNQAFLASSEHMVHTAERLAAMVGDPRDISQALLRQTTSLAEELVIDPQRDLGLGQVYVPELHALLPNEQRSAVHVLNARCDDALDDYVERHGAHVRHDARARVDAELQVINQLGFAGYVLTVAEVVDMVKRMGIRVAARGSGAGSFINHIVGISGVDPLQHGLLMERFLSTLRPGLPDIDIDVESARRTEIYDAIFDRFGPERTTCVSMRETYRVRHAIRDVGAALGMSASDIGTFAKSFPHIRARHIRSALTELPELRRSGIGRLIYDGKLEQFLDLVEGLDGLPRHIALHPCGVVLSDSSLLSRTPVQPSAQNYPMSQFDKDDVEHMGLLKLDVLGVRMQSALAYATDEVKRTEQVDLDLDRMPLDDPETFQLIQSTRVLGCFQIESPGQRELVGKFGPEVFDDLIIDISLFRPGPVKSDMIGPFLRGRKGWEQPSYIHPDLQSVLESTSGVVVFHEQVMQVIATMTRCSLEYADLIRRQLGDWNQLDRIREWFYLECKKHGYALDVVERVWEVLRAFASFGFCKAHAAAFALPTYQSAWLKTHHPAAFFAGVLTHDPGMYPKRLIVDDARSFGVPILGLDVNRSRATFAVERVDTARVGAEHVDDEPAGGGSLGVRIALDQVKGISDGEVAKIIAGQPYDSLADFVARGHASYPTVERLIVAGGFDSLHGQRSRRDLLLHLRELSREFKLVARGYQVSDAQIAFSVDYQQWTPTPTGLPPMTASDQVRHEIEVLGLDLSAHVVSFYLPMLRELSVTMSNDLLNTRSNTPVLVAGVKVSTQTPPIRSGKRVAFVTVDDSTGPVDVAFFEDSLNMYAPTLFHSWLLLMRGKLRRTGAKGVSIVADGCWELATVYDCWKRSGVAGVQQMMSVQPYDGSEQVTPTRVWEHASGFRSTPFADVSPAGSANFARPTGSANFAGPAATDIARGMRSSARMAP